MLELERNSQIDTEDLVEFFARCGWQEADAGTKLEWVLAASDEWVVCRLDGQLVGFGRSCLLEPAKRIVFDVLVDPRFEATLLKSEIVRLLTEDVSSLEEVSVFSERPANPPNPSSLAENDVGPGHLPLAPPKTYLGRHVAGSREDE